MTLLENVEHVLEAMTDLRDLRNRLAAIDEERAAVEAKIRARLSEIASAAEVVQPAFHAVSLVPPSAPPPLARPARTAGMTERVLATVNEHAGEAAITAMEIARFWGQTDESTINSIRAALSRLTADNKIRKVGYGRYMALGQGGESAA